MSFRKVSIPMSISSICMMLRLRSTRLNSNLWTTRTQLPSRLLWPLLWVKRTSVSGTTWSRDRVESQCKPLIANQMKTNGWSKTPIGRPNSISRRTRFTSAPTSAMREETGPQLSTTKERRLVALSGSSERMMSGRSLTTLTLSTRKAFKLPLLSKAKIYSMSSLRLKITMVI